MLDFSFGELGLIVLVALIIVGPKDLPVVMRTLGLKSAMQESQLKDIENDINAIHEEVKFIRDEQGNLQRVYDISDFLDERERTKVVTSLPQPEEKNTTP